MESFVKNYLRTNGILILHMIESNSGKCVVTKLTQQLWMSFLEEDNRVEI